MTDQTVPVPVDMLRRLQEQVVQRQWDTDGAYEVLLQGSAVNELIDLIPAPPKVGDSIDAADQIAALPDHSVLIDADGEPWTVVGGEPLYYLDGKREGRGLLVRTYGPLTLVHLGATSD